jgi:hypothetical protein
MSAKNIELIRQALGAAESSIKLAKQLLSELESGTSLSQNKANKPTTNDLPGITGVFDGENMVTETGESFPVPSNYASKSMLVVGDTLKLVEEGKNKEKRFKQVEHVKRHKSNGILTKKDGKWKVVTPEGSYKVLGAAVEHFGADIGAEVTLHLPANNLTVGYGAIESVVGKAKAEIHEPVSVDKTAINQETVKVSEKKEKEVKTEAPKKPEIKNEVKKEEQKVSVKREQAPKKEDKAPIPKQEKTTPSPKPAPVPVVPAAPAVVPQTAAPVPAPPPAQQVPAPITNSMEVASEEEELT